MRPATVFFVSFTIDRIIMVADFLHKKTLIVGDVNSGKTQYTLNVLETFIRGGITDIAVLDLAPETTGGIGGKMGRMEHAAILYLTTAIAAPRLSGMNENETTLLARKNARAIEGLFGEYLAHPREVLFINDTTLYLHAGKPETLFHVLDTAATQVLNAYYGTTFADSPLSRRERQLVDLLMTRCDKVIKLSTDRP